MKGTTVKESVNQFFAAKITEETIKEISAYNQDVDLPLEIEDPPIYFVFGDDRYRKDYVEIYPEVEFYANFMYKYASDRNSTFRSCSKI